MTARPADAATVASMARRPYPEDRLPEISAKRATAAERGPDRKHHVVEVVGVDGRWLVYAFGDRAQCELGAAKFRASFGAGARVIAPEDRDRSRAAPVRGVVAVPSQGDDLRAGDEAPREAPEG